MSELAYGLHTVLSALKETPDLITCVWVHDQARPNPRIAEVLDIARSRGIPVKRIPGKELDQLSGGGRHQGVAAEIRAAKARAEAELEPLLAGLNEPAFLLVLDGVQDPHNLGACLRTAEGAGVHAVIVPKDRAVGLTATARKVASGAADRVPFFMVTNLARTLRQLKEQGVWLVGTADEVTQSLYDIDLVGPLAIVMGSEGKGLRRLTEELCDFVVRIPMAGAVSSLNVSVATGVCLYEAVRQRSKAQAHQGGEGKPGA